MTHPQQKIPSATLPLPYPSLADEDPISVLQLIRSENIGPVTFFHLLSFYGSVARVIEALPNLTRKATGRRKISLLAREVAEKEYEATLRFGAVFTLYGDAHYPALLAQIHDPPPIVSVRGNVALCQSDSIAIVGARNASANGCQFARTLARDLGKAGLIIISGLARGIDAFAHSGALESGTVGIIAGGIDNIYPPQNEKLFADMAARGAILSENPLGTEPQARHFPSRNRIIAGISRGVAVVEASHKSGTLITANYALDYGREVFAVPGSPLDPRCAGTNDLLKDGAHLITGAEDILKQLRAPRSFELRECVRPVFAAFPTQEPSENELENARAILNEKLGASPIPLDELMNQCQLPAQLLQFALLEMELAGEIQRHAGGKVSKRY